MLTPRYFKGKVPSCKPKLLRILALLWGGQCLGKKYRFVGIDFLTSDITVSIMVTSSWNAYQLMFSFFNNVFLMMLKTYFIRYKSKQDKIFKCDCWNKLLPFLLLVSMFVKSIHRNKSIVTSTVFVCHFQELDNGSYQFC